METVAKQMRAAKTGRHNYNFVANFALAHAPDILWSIIHDSKIDNILYLTNIAWEITF